MSTASNRTTRAAKRKDTHGEGTEQPQNPEKITKSAGPEEEPVKIPFQFKTNRSAHLLWEEIEPLGLDGIRWPKSKVMKLIRAFNRCHSIQYDGKGDTGSLGTVMAAFEKYIINKPDLIELLDPHYVCVFWNNVAPVPLQQWILTADLVGRIVQVENAGETYTVQTSELAHSLASLIATHYPGVQAVPFSTSLPVVPKWRIL
jgi:hypothetical protein